MRKTKFNICLALCASLLTSMSIGAATPDATPLGLDLTTDQLKVSYAIGAKSAEELKQYNLDVQAYLAGYRDTAMGTTLKLSEKEMNAAIAKLQQELTAKHDAEKKVMDQKMKEAATSNLTAGTKF